MSTRTNISSGAPYEPIFGYSRAVKVGNQIFVSGSTAIQPDGSVTGVGDMYTQAMTTLRTIEKALQQGGASMQHVVRTRMFVTDISKTEEVGKAHAEFFRDVRPASTLVEVSRLVHPDMLIEIEADAVITD